jgi:N-dimethylarginine dimethylaminohydrolase
MTPLPHILMCPPVHYGIEYEINPWMNRDRQADHALANQQWSQLRAILEGLGATVSLVEPVKGLPDLVFTANAGMMYRNVAILSRFRHPQRRGEEPCFQHWFEDNDFSVLLPPKDVYFEGAGDALFCGDTLFAGYLIRSAAGGHQKIGELIGQRVIPLELVDQYYYHLDTCFCPLAPGVAAYFPGAFDDYGRRVLRDNIGDLLEVDADEARSFACNAVVVGENVVTNSGCPKLHAALKSRGFTPHATPLSEFVKAGGSAKCLTLRLDGEEAAAWKQRK